MCSNIMYHSPGEKIIFKGKYEGTIIAKQLVGGSPEPWYTIEFKVPIDIFRATIVKVYGDDSFQSMEVEK